MLSGVETSLNVLWFKSKRFPFGFAQGKLSTSLGMTNYNCCGGQEILTFQGSEQLTLQTRQRFAHYTAGAIDIFRHMRRCNKSGFKVSVSRINAAHQTS